MSYLNNMVNWIKCENLLPEEADEYLTCNADGIQSVQYFDGEEWGYLGSLKATITHWTKLPTAPQFEEANRAHSKFMDWVKNKD